MCICELFLVPFMVYRPISECLLGPEGHITSKIAKEATAPTMPSPTCSRWSELRRRLFINIIASPFCCRVSDESVIPLIWSKFHATMAIVEWSTTISVIANDIHVPSGFRAAEFIVKDVMSEKTNG